MVELNIFKEVTLPETLVANSIYLVAPVDGNDLNIYVTGIDASVVRRTLNKVDIAAQIEAAVLAVHSHSNQALLNSLDTDEAGKLTVNGNRVSNVVFATPTW